MPEGYSFQTGERKSLVPLDYILFSLMFVVSAFIGFYHAYRWRKRTSEEEFHFAGRSLHPLPVSMSLSATFFSAITILGIPAEVYTHNTMFLWSIASSLISTIFVAHVFVPFFYDLQIKSIFKYIELRFGKPLRLIASSLFLVQNLLYAAVALYLPCLALETIMRVSLWYTMLIVCVVCTMYTLMGGMRTVVWVDSLQLIVIVAGLLAAVIAGSNATGGLSAAWRVATENHRVKFNDFSVDPRARHSVWSVSIGFSLLLMYNYGLTQVQVQRVCTVSSSKKATIASWLAFPTFAFIQFFVCMTGVIMYAFYSKCDPVTFKLIHKNDQLVPLFVTDVLGSLPGLPGLFLACIFSGSLSSISSCMNTVCTVLLDDFVKPFCCPRFAERKGLFVSRILVLVIACFQFLAAAVVSKMDRLIFQLTNSLYAVVSGPLMGLFISGMFLPWTNRKGALAGLVVSIGVMLWLCVGALLEKPAGVNPLPSNTSDCNWNITSFHTNITILTQTTILAEHPEETLLHNFYRMSYLWYTGFGMIVNVFTTLVVSFITGSTKPSHLDSRLFCPIFDILFPWLPERFRRVLRCNINCNKNKGNTDDINRETGDIDELNQGTKLIDVL